MVLVDAPGGLDQKVSKMLFVCDPVHPGGFRGFVGDETLPIFLGGS